MLSPRPSLPRSPMNAPTHTRRISLSLIMAAHGFISSIHAQSPPASPPPLPAGRPITGKSGVADLYLEGFQTMSEAEKLRDKGEFAAS